MLTAIMTTPLKSYANTAEPGSTITLFPCSSWRAIIPPPFPPAPAHMNDEQLTRYSRHILLPEIDIDGQQAWMAAHVLIVGAGGLGGPAALFLAAAGIGHLTIADADTVELGNLQRQIVHSTQTLGRPKVESARDHLLNINPEVKVSALPRRLEGEILEQQVKLADVVLDCSDNFSTRHAVNAACVRQKKPLISGAAVRFDGQIAVFDGRDPAAPCYHCLFPEHGDERDMPCSLFGVFSPLVGIVGSWQAAEALKLLAGFGEPLTGRLLLIDLLSSEMRCIRVPRDPACPVCAAPTRV